MPADSFVRSFRESSPYIHRFRGQTFVINFGGDAIADGSIRGLAHDIALLNSLGINVVLVHGAGPQIDAALQVHGLQTQRVNGKRITSPEAMQVLREAVGGARLVVEAALSEGQMGSPMAHAGLQVVSGNFIIAQPLGILDGVDYQSTGQVRRVANEAMERHLAADEIILLSPIGVSPTGTLFNIRAEEVAVAAAIALGAAKTGFLYGGGRRSGRRWTAPAATDLFRNPQLAGPSKCFSRCPRASAECRSSLCAGRRTGSSDFPACGWCPAPRTVYPRWPGHADIKGFL
jgi:amino-acid N-acetyltransferase